jgi:succinyl-CoA synthetase beta subunit/citryl-CoA synthetase large subunit
LAVTYDTVAKQVVLLASLAGGMDVEALSQKAPGSLTRRALDVRRPLYDFEAREIGRQLGLSGRDLLEFAAAACQLVQAFLALDCTLLEVNPLALTEEGRCVLADAHLEVDEDALFRQSQLEHIPRRETSGRTPTEFERKAAAVDALDHRGVAGRVIEFAGNLGLLIGGGGASLTAFDAIKRHGGHPANYCEIGGNPSVRKVAELTKLILSRPEVDRVAVISNVVSNTRVDLFARGVIKGILDMGKDPALTIAVFRVPGSWEDEGVAVLQRYHVPYCDRTVSIDEAARRAVIEER